MYGNAALQKNMDVWCGVILQLNTTPHSTNETGLFHWELLCYPLYSLGLVTENSLFGLLKQHLAGH
jgi:hypothetical protein